MTFAASIEPTGLTREEAMTDWMLFCLRQPSFLVLCGAIVAAIVFEVYDWLTEEE